MTVLFQLETLVCVSSVCGLACLVPLYAKVADYGKCQKHPLEKKPPSDDKRAYAVGGRRRNYALLFHSQSVIRYTL